MKTIAELRNAILRKALGAVKAEVVRIAGEDARLIIYGSYARGEEREDSDVDIMVILPDEVASEEIEDIVWNAIFEVGYETDFLLSAIIVSESQVKKFEGFKVFGSVEKEGVPI